jgi:Leucine-rich repeat (LRR) protein
MTEARLKFIKLAKMKDDEKKNITRLEIVDKKIVSQLKEKPTGFNVLQDMPNLRTLIIEQDGNDKIKTLPPTIFAGLTKLDSLELKSLWLANLPETIFQDLTDLTSLSIEYNDFKSLPATLFKNNKKLKKIVIRNDDSLRTLPENIFQGLEQLEELDLNGNSLTSLPERIFQGLPNLKILDLDRNDFTTLPEGIFDGLHLEEPIPADILSLVVKKASVKQVLKLEQEAEDDEALPGDKNTCYAVIDLYDKNIDKYLAKDPGNFILKVGKNKECESLENLKLQYFSAELNDYEGYYECSQKVIDKQTQTGRTEIAFREGDYYPEVEYVKVGSYNNFIVKPDWFYEGPAPEPRIFQLVSSGVKKRLISKRIATHHGVNVVSDIHCDPLDTFDIYELKPVFLKSTTPKQTAQKSNSKSKSRRKSKSKSRRKSKSKSRRKSKSKSRRSRIYTLNRTRRNSTASDINVGGMRKPKRKTRKFYRK